MMREFRKEGKELKEKDMMILCFDKSNYLVLMDRRSYLEKMEGTVKEIFIKEKKDISHHERNEGFI